MDRGLIHDLFFFFHLDGFHDVQVHQSQKQKFSNTLTHFHHHLSHQHLSQLLHPGTMLAATDGMTYPPVFEPSNPWNVRMPILPQLPNHCTLYLKSDLMSHLRSCVMLFTGNIQGNISFILAVSDFSRSG